MSFVFGGSMSRNSSKSEGTFNKSGSNTSSGTTRAVAPSWIEDAVKGVTGKISSLAGANPTDFVPGQDPMHAAATATAGMLSGQPWNYEAAMDITKGVATGNAPQTSGVRAKNFMADYENQHMKDVIDASLADYDYETGLRKAQLDLDMNRAGAFGGSGAALERDLAADSISRGRASLGAGLRSEGFNTALAAAQADAAREQGARDLNAQLFGQNKDRALAGAGQLAGLASEMEGNTRANVATQLGLGDALRAISGEVAQAPLSLASWAADTLPAILGQFIGQDVTGVENFTESGTEKSKSKGKGSQLGFSVAGGSGK